MGADLDRRSPRGLLTAERSSFAAPAPTVTQAPAPESKIRNPKSEIDAVPFTENGLRFFADVSGGQKTGFFLDQRDNRARLRALSLPGERS